MMQQAVVLKRCAGIFGMMLFSAVLLGGCDNEKPELGETAKLIDAQSAKLAVTFPHSEHTAQYDVACQTCHHETNAAQLENPHPHYFDDSPVDCKICHQAADTPQSPQACVNCHHSRPMDIADETLGAKVVVHQTCWTCHEIGRGAAASKQCGFCHAKQ